MRLDEAARAYLNVRWQHQGRTLDGLDCIGLVRVAARDAGAVPAQKLAELDAVLGGYGRQPDGRLLALCRQYMTEIVLTAAQPGDVLAMRYQDEPQHLAIVSAAGSVQTIIHAHAVSRKVVEHRLDDLNRSRVVAAFRP
jgi:cell wall-associated NlpC family hydrolase